MGLAQHFSGAGWLLPVMGCGGALEELLACSPRTPPNIRISFSCTAEERVLNVSFTANRKYRYCARVRSARRQNSPELHSIESASPSPDCETESEPVQSGPPPAVAFFAFFLRTETQKGFSKVRRASRLTIAYHHHVREHVLMT